MEPDVPYGGMMRLLAIDNPLSRLFKGFSERADYAEYEVVMHGRAPGMLTQEELEGETEDALDLLLERAPGIALGAAAGYNLDNNEIELVCTIQASSAEQLHKRIGQIVRLLEDRGPFSLHDSATSRLDPEHEPVPA